MADLEVTEWTLDGVLDEIKIIDSAMKDRQFAFILGAGASFTSGIPTGQGLAQKWLKDLHLRECSNGSSLEQWIIECGIGNGGLTFQTAAEHYPQIFERRFEGDREAGYAELESVMEGKAPSLGYSLLAEIIQHTRHKVVVTTNFDNLVADSLAMHVYQSPLVVAHESLAGFVRPKMRRPLVAKIHRDLYLHPINDPDGVSTMEQGWKIALKKLFQYFTPIVVGYGGNDGSLMDMLIELDKGDISGRIIWCYREESPPPEKAMKVLRKHQGILVKIPGFDEFMLQMADKLVTGFDVAAIAERIVKLGEFRAERYRDQASKLTESASNGSPAEQRAVEVLTHSVRPGQSWWAWEIKANAEPDPENRNRIYLEGIKQFPKSAELAGTYARFLESKMLDIEASEKMFEHALKLDPNNARNNCNYASFLETERKEYKQAEEFYKKAVELEPFDSLYLTRYANFLTRQKADEDFIDALYKRAFELDPNSGFNACSYANFLAHNRADYNAAEIMYKNSIELDPTSSWNIGNYAEFLEDSRKEHDKAELLFKKATELNPDSSWLKGKYERILARRNQINK